MCFCTGTTEYDPYHEPAPRVPTHTAYARPASRSSFHSYNRRSGGGGGGHVAALPPPSSRRSYDHQHHHRSSVSSMPAERRYVEHHEPQPRHSVQLVERRPRSRGVSPGGRVVRTERERVVYV